MKIISVDKNIIRKLRESGVSTKMKSLESCDWVVLYEENGIIGGAAGMGGMFNVSGIQLNENFRGKGYGKKIQKELVDEARKRNYSFVTVFVDPRNNSSIKMHDGLGYETIFRIHYSKDIIQDIKIIIFKKRGVVVKKFLGCFNTKIGIFFLACILKTSRSLFKKMITYNEEQVPIPDIKWIIKKFEKIQNHPIT